MMYYDDDDSNDADVGWLMMEDDDFDKFMENNIDINQYIQYDEKVCDMIIYFNKNKFLADALEYLQNDNQDYQIIVEE